MKLYKKRRSTTCCITTADYMDERRIVKDELIGRSVIIKECTDPTFIGIAGVVIDETKNTFLIETRNKQKMIAKETSTFEFEYNGRKIIIQGSKLIYRPEDRTKKAR